MVEKIVALTSRKEFRLKLDMLPSKLRRNQTASSKVGRQQSELSDIEQIRPNSGRVPSDVRQNRPKI